MATQLANKHGRNLDCSEEEWAIRQELAACYRIFDLMGWSESIYNHISARVPGDDNAFLINPYGLLYSEICASNLVKIDIDGNNLDGSAYPVNKAGFTQHAYFHRHLDWAHAICHTHTTATMAVASLEGGLQPVNFYACNFTGRIGYHDFEGVTVRAEVVDRLIANLGDKRILFLRNHGPVILGKTLPEIFLTHWVFQRACEIQLATLSMGAAIHVPEAVAEKCTRDSLQFDAKFGAGRDVFDAMRRLVDKQDDSYKH